MKDLKSKLRKLLRENRGGDAVAAVAKPIARAIDAAAGTHWETCAPCAARHRWLNGVTRMTAAAAARAGTVYELP